MDGPLADRGELVEILPDWPRDPIPLYIVCPQTRHLSNKVRVFVDWLAKRLQTAKNEEAQAHLGRLDGVSRSANFQMGPLSATG